jgi:hypothetical protein
MSTARYALFGYNLAAPRWKIVQYVTSHDSSPSNTRNSSAYGYIGFESSPFVARRGQRHEDGRVLYGTTASPHQNGRVRPLGHFEKLLLRMRVQTC